jgi:hypothetical protein
MAEMPSTHYVKSDDVYIAYQVLGEGSFDLMFVTRLRVERRGNLAIAESERIFPTSRIILSRHPF